MTSPAGDDVVARPVVMNSESTAPADHLQRSVAQPSGLWNRPPTVALVACEARAVDCTIGPPVSTPRTGAPKSGRPQRHFCSSTRHKRRALAQTSGARLNRRYRAAGPGPGLRGGTRAHVQTVCKRKIDAVGVEMLGRLSAARPP
eukprot:6615484-Prymnesium_polylepis.1